MMDLHTHSISSGHAINTIDELIYYASKKGITHLGITDHGPSMEGAPHEGYFWVSDKLPRKVNNVELYMGVEANIIDINGNLDLSDDMLLKQRLVTAGLHDKTPYGTNNKQSNTQAIINTIKSGKCAIIVHPIRDNFPAYIDAIAEEAVRNNVLLELNNQTFSDISKTTLADYKKLVKIVKNLKGHLIIGSDSHTHFTLGEQSNVIKYGKQLELTEDILVNNNPDLLRKYVK